MNYDGAQLCGADITAAARGGQCRWPSPDISWTITANLPGFAREAFRDAAALAWSYWSDVCGVRPRFVESGFANVLMGIQSQGPGGVLADSELPCGVTMQHSLKQRYDTAEAWVVSENPPGNKIDLVRVIAHELGHVIGIPHISGANLLAPTYSSRIRRPQTGDIAEAVSRYGLPSAPPVPPPTPPSDDLEEIASLLLKDGQLFIRARGVTKAL